MFVPVNPLVLEEIIPPLSKAPLITFTHKLMVPPASPHVSGRVIQASVSFLYPISMHNLPKDKC